MPDEVDRQSLFSIASMLGRNRAPEREPWPQDAPHIKVLRRNLALSEDREPPKSDDPISGDEYRKLIAMAKSGTRRERSAHG